MMQAFVDAIIRCAHDKEFDADFSDGLNAQLAMEAGLKSAASRRVEPVDYKCRTDLMSGQICSPVT
jgi:hypothetical protein